MQPGGRCGHGARFTGEHRLVARLVVAAGGVRDVGRQRQAAVCFGQLPEIAAFRQFQRKKLLSRSRPAGDRDLEGVGQAQLRSRFRRFAGAHLRQRVTGIDDALDQHLDLAATAFLAKESCPDDLGVVENQQVARRQQAGQVGEAQIDECWPADVQQPAGRA